MQITGNYNNYQMNFNARHNTAVRKNSSAILTLDKDSFQKSTKTKRSEGYFDTGEYPIHWTKAMGREVEHLERELMKKVNNCINTLFDLRFEGMDLRNEIKEKGEDIVKLYRTKAKKSPFGGKIETDGNYMTEYASDNKTIRRRTEFKTTQEKKFFFFNKNTSYITRMVECRPDGKFNLYLDGKYTEGYRWYDDNSECYDRQVVLVEPKGNSEMRFFSKGYKIDSLGNESWEISSFKKDGSNATGIFECINSYRIGETKFSDGTQTIDFAYRIGGRHHSDSTEEFIENYTRTPSGKVHVGKEVTALIPSELKSYRENYTRYPDNRENWTKSYKRENKYKNWICVIPTYTDKTPKSAAS